MKKLYSIVLILSLLVLVLSGCSNNELEQKRLEMQEHNIKVEESVNVYRINNSNANAFDELFIDMLSLDYDSFIEVLNSEDCELNEYLEQSSGYYTAFLSLKGGIYKTVNDYVNVLKQSTVGMRTEEDVEIVETELSVDFEYNVKDNIKCYHFLDSSNNTFEELIIVDVPTCSYYLSLEWSGGKIIRVELERV